MSTKANSLPVSIELQQKLSVRIKDMLLDMIPDEKINELIGGEIAAFFEGESLEFVFHEAQNGWGATTYDKSQKLVAKVTPFRAMVWNECRKWTEERMQNFFNGEGSDWQVTLNQFWDGESGMHDTTAVLSAELEKRLEEQALKMAATMFRSMFGQAAITAKMAVTQDLMNGNISVPRR